jgi:ABC-type Mn2+/Zn2+ transport system permease subunit
MIKDIIKVLTAIVVGYFLGFPVGALLGGVLGFITSIFFQEIVHSNYTVFMSFAMAIVLGGSLGYIATEAGRKIFETSDHPLFGIISGVAISFIVILYYGVVYIPDPNIFDQRFFRIPVSYGATIGQYISTILFPLIGIRGIVYEAMETRKRIKANEESKNELSFYKSRKTEENK